MKVHITQHQHPQNGGAANQQQHARQVMPGLGLEMPGAQQQRHHQLVADHGGHRNGFHDHHAGGRRQPANEGKQGQGGLARSQRQRQDKIVGIHLPRSKIQQAAQSNRQHKQIDGQQVQRKHPDGAAQVALAHVFHHHHLELARQKDHRKHRQQRQGKPLGPGKVAALLQAQQLGQLGHGVRARKEIGQPIEQTINHKQAHRQKSNELDHRLKGNGRHQPFVALRRIQVPGAKHHGETGQRQRQVKRAVLRPMRLRGQRAERTGGEQAVPRRDRLELQRNVGHDAHHRNQRHQAGQQRTFAIAAANEVGNRGDAVGLGDADHLAQHQPAQCHGQRGPQINRQKPDAAGSGTADAAKVGPGGAIDRQRQGIGPGVGNDRAALGGTPVTKAGHRKQQQQVSKGCPDNQQR